MRRVRIEPVTKTRFRIYLDGQFAFVLYKSELVSCKVKDGEEISDEQVEVILKGIILKRAKQKALSLLQSMDRTKSELRERLLRQDFPEKIADEAVPWSLLDMWMTEDMWRVLFFPGKDVKVNGKFLPNFPESRWMKPLWTR